MKHAHHVKKHNRVLIFLVLFSLDMQIFFPKGLSLRDGWASTFHVVPWFSTNFYSRKKNVTFGRGCVLNHNSLVMRSVNGRTSRGVVLAAARGSSGVGVYAVRRDVRDLGAVQEMMEL